MRASTEKPCAGKFAELRSLNVNEHVEKKGGLSYLSWAWAVDYLLQEDPAAWWEFDEPISFGESVMVRCRLHAFGKTIQMHLPVMDNRNNAINNPDARKISDAMMRCLTKAIACVGIGLYIYAGEDLPSDEAEAADAEVLNALRAASLEGTEALREAFTAAKEKDAVTTARVWKEHSASLREAATAAANEGQEQGNGN